MTTRLFAVAATLAALLTPALAEEPATAPAAQNETPAVEVGETVYIRSQPAGAVFASDLVGLDILGSDNKKIGDVNDILITGDGAVAAVVIGVGGFLGLGEKDVAVPLSSLKISAVDGHTQASIDATERDLLEAPLFERADGTTSDRLGAFERTYERTRENAEAALDTASKRAGELYDRAQEEASGLREGAQELIDSGRSAIETLREGSAEDTPSTQ